MRSTVVLLSIGMCMVLVPLAAWGASAPPVEEGFDMRVDGSTVTLASSSFRYCLDTAKGLRAVSWENLLTGTRVSLGEGDEMGLDLDTADARIWIERLPAEVLIPAEARDKPLSLTMGGFGIYDYRFMQVRLNGHVVGVRDAPQRWREPLVTDLGPASAFHEYVRFGDTNALETELGGFVDRSPRLETLDPRGTRELPVSIQWPANFEKYLTVGEPHETPAWEVVDCSQGQRGESQEAVFTLSATGLPLTATVTYRWQPDSPILRKSVEIHNAGATARRLLHVRLGDYATDAKVSDGERGFPVYLQDAFFASVAHPAGWATGQNGRVLMRQFPGVMLEPEATFSCFDVVMGVTPAGGAKNGFVSHIRERMRRVVRGHGQPRAIFSNFGSWPLEPSNFSNPRFSQNSEEDVLRSLGQLAESRKVTGPLFDTCSVDFWHDHAGDFKQFDPAYFPDGFSRIREALRDLNITPGVWISTNYAGWGLGDNPEFDPCRMPPGNAHCVAAQPYRGALVSGLEHQIRENGVRQVKVDGLYGNCDSPDHGHLPGIYSTEAQFCAMVDAYERWDRANPDVFIMLYWGSRSPWWLLWADTLFDPGIMIEASSPAENPTPYARDSVTVGLDQAQWYCDEVPVLGKDSLGIWLSDWWWNSSIGKERWQEGFVMDLCRGSLLAQVWSNQDWLPDDELRHLADFIHLLKARPDCFGNPKFIVGNPWDNEPYGYCCSNGRRAFVALNNCVWRDTTIGLTLDSRWGMPDGGRWDLYRWYPDPARLQDGMESLPAEVSIHMKPFEVILLEAVPDGEPPTLDRDFQVCPLHPDTNGASGAVDITVRTAHGENGTKVQVSGQLPGAPTGGTLVVSVSMSREGRAAMVGDIGQHVHAAGTLDGDDVTLEPVLGTLTYPACWQAWRMRVTPSDRTVPFGVDITADVDSSTVFAPAAYFIAD